MRLLRSFETWCERHADVGLLALRLVAGGHLIYMSQDNVFSWARMLHFRDFLQQYGFPFPLLCAVVSVWAQFVGGIALVLGLGTRLVGAVIVFNFIVAIAMVESANPYPAAYPALSLLAAALCLMLLGPGRYSADRAMKAPAS